jgi:hypothetical protein
MVRLGLYIIAALAVFVSAAGCGSGGGKPAIHVHEGSQRLTALLRQGGLEPGEQAKPTASLGRAWRAFKQFAAVPVHSDELSDEPENDGFLFEFGLLGGSSQMSFVRQLATSDGDLQQVHLDVTFPQATFSSVMAEIKVRPCGEDEGCPTRCSTRVDELVGTPCLLEQAVEMAHSTLRSAGTWSYDTGGSSNDEELASWIAFVESSPVFRDASRELKPLRYHVWQESAE